jgi:hypothetical protein
MRRRARWPVPFNPAPSSWRGRPVFYHSAGRPRLGSVIIRSATGGVAKTDNWKKQRYRCPLRGAYQKLDFWAVRLAFDSRRTRHCEHLITSSGAQFLFVNLLRYNLGFILSLFREQSHLS